MKGLMMTYRRSGSTGCSQHKSSGAAKHIDIEYYIVIDKVQDQVISLEHISTEKILTDSLTKGLPPNVFREHVASMGLWESLKFLDKRKPKD